MQVEATFRDPPLVETVLGLHFHPIGRWTPAHAGEFWHLYLRNKWPSVNIENPLSQQEEVLDQSGLWRPALPNFSIGSDAPSPRMQFANSTGERMVQLQDSWLLYNWRRGGEEYPTYQTLKPEFFEKYSELRNYVNEHGFSPISPRLWEVTYVNRIPIDSVWGRISDWNELIPSMLGPSANLSVGDVESFNENWIVRLHGNKGRLRVTIRHIKYGPEDREAIDFRLAARGPLSASASDEDIGNAFDIGHDAIVQTFLESVSKDAQEKWGRVG